MKVALVHKDIGATDRGGVSVLYKTLASELVSQGVDVTIISQYSDSLEEFESIQLPIVSDPVEYAAEVARVLSREKFDIVECSTWRFELLQYLKSHTHRAKTIVRCDPSTATLFGHDHRYVESERALVALADHRIAVSVFSKDDIENAYGTPVEDVVFNGINLDLFSGTRQPSRTLVQEILPNIDLEKSEYALWIGKRSLMKGFDLFQQFLQHAPPDLDIVMLESPAVNPLDWMVDTARRVTVLSPVSRELQIQLIRSAKCGLIFSRWEGYSYVCAEMLACGIPVFCNSDCTVIREFNAREQIAYFDADRPASLTRLMNDYPYDNECNYVVDSISSRRMASETLQVYRQVLA